MRRRVFALAIVLAAAAATALALAYDGRIVPGVRVAGIAVGGESTASAREILRQRTNDARVTLVGDGSRVALDASEGLGVDIDRAADEAMAIGRTGNALDRAAAIAGAITSRVDIPLRRIVIDPARFDATLDLAVASLERSPIDGAVSTSTAGVTVREPEAGVAIDRTALQAAIFQTSGVDADVDIPLRYVTPELDTDAITDAAAAARNASLPLVVTAGTERTVIAAPRLLALVSIAREQTPDGEALVASLSDAGLDALVAEVAGALDGSVREAVLVPGGERLGVVAGRDGVVVDRAAARAALATAIVGSDRALELPAAITHPAVSTATAERTSQALVLVGGYTTYFPINPARATNIGAAARTFDGMSVAPGDTFSFWERLGEVSPRMGYVYAGTIIGGISAEAIGGGLCQVSTTFFNAAARAGYEIDERHEHSYYIERYPLGLDAAVFAPTTDMRWTNDTALPALIRAAATDTSVSFWLYSAPLGREVSFTDPLEWDLRWPYAGQPADPAHAPGYVVLGRDTSVTRTVIENGTVIHRDTWYSHYAPVWGGPAY